MLKIKIYRLAIVLLAVILLITAMPFRPSIAAPVTVFADIPPEIPKGTTVAVNISIGSVSSLKSWEFKLTYNPGTIAVTGKEGFTGVKNGKIGEVESIVNPWGFSPAGTQGTIVAKGRTASIASGKGSLAIVSFIAVGNPGSESEITITEIKLTDASGNSIQAAGGSKTVTVVSAPVITTSTTTAAASTPTATSTKTTSPAATSTGKTPATTAAGTDDTTEPSSEEPDAPTEKPPVTISIAVPPNVPMLEEFIIRIDVEKVTGLDSYHFVLDYNPEVLEVRDVTPGTIGSTDTKITEWALTPPETQGRVEVMGAIPGGKGVNGSGFLAKVYCQIIGEMGDTSELSLSEIELMDIEGDMLELEEIETATVEVESTRVSIQAPEEIPPNGKFEVTIDISQVNDLASYSLNLNYNGSVIEVIEVNPGIIGPTDIPVDDWDFIPSDKQGQIYIRGTIDEDLEGVSGIGYLAKIQCLAVGRVSQRSRLTLENVELMDVNGETIRISPSRDVSVLISEVSFLSSTAGLVVVSVAGLVVIGLVVFLVLRMMRRRKKETPGRPSPPAGKSRKAEETGDLMEVMRNRISQLPSKRTGRKPDSDDDQPQ